MAAVQSVNCLVIQFFSTIFSAVNQTNTTRWRKKYRKWKGTKIATTMRKFKQDRIWAILRMPWTISKTVISSANITALARNNVMYSISWPIVSLTSTSALSQILPDRCISLGWQRWRRKRTDRLGNRPKRPHGKSMRDEILDGAVWNNQGLLREVAFSHVSIQTSNRHNEISCQHDGHDLRHQAYQVLRCCESSCNDGWLVQIAEGSKSSFLHQNEDFKNSRSRL